MVKINDEVIVSIKLKLFKLFEVVSEGILIKSYMYNEKKISFFLKLPVFFFTLAKRKIH